MNAAQHTPGPRAHWLACIAEHEHAIADAKRKLADCGIAGRLYLNGVVNGRTRAIAVLRAAIAKAREAA